MSHAHTFVVGHGPETVHGERVKRPEPKVLDADGAEIRVGDTVYDVEDGCELVVTKVTSDAVFVAFEDVEADKYDASQLTHRAPVLAADGRPLREGETAWGTKGGSYHLTSVHDDKVFARHVGGSFGAEVESAGGEGLYRLRADKLTHECPVADTWERLEEDVTLSVERYRELYGIKKNDGMTWPQLVRKDLVRRAKALAGRGA